MQVFCLATSESELSDIQCSVCGQKYALYFERKSVDERLVAVQAVKDTFERHHVDAGSAETTVHAQAFTVPAWHGPAHMSGAAILGGAPPWAA